MSQNYQESQQQQILAPSSPTNNSRQMNPNSTNSDGIMLFACTKCNSRHKFEELSRRHQLCRTCKSSLKLMNCDYCSGEFKLDGINDKTKICSKCHQLQEQYGKPKICSCCNLKAAFIGDKCHRCNNSEKKYGSPLNCEHCNKKCAFERPDPESRAKVDGKLLCWTCTMDFKRSQAKEKHRQSNEPSRASRHPRDLGRVSDAHTKHTSSTSDHKHDRHRHHHHRRSHRSPPRINGQVIESSFNDTHHRNHQHNNSSSLNRDSNSSTLTGTHTTNGKRPRLEHRPSHPSNSQLTSASTTNIHVSSLSDNIFSEPQKPELTSAMIQLKEEIAGLNKKLILKDRELLSKDQQIADLKSTLAREQKELREKIQSMQKQHTERITGMQSKLVSLQKQIATQSRASRATTTPSSAFLEPPMVI